MSNIKYNEETGLCASVKINPLGQQRAYVGNDDDCNMVLWAMRLGGICNWGAINDYNKRYRQMQTESPQDFLVVSRGMIADVKTNLVMPIPELKIKKGINDFVFGSDLNNREGEGQPRWHWGAWTALENGKKRIVPYEKRSGQITQQHLLLAKMLKKTLDFC